MIVQEGVVTCMDCLEGLKGVRSGSGDLILDPTAGSGTALVVAKRLGRRFIGFETDESMVAKATSRIDRVVLETGAGVR